MGEKMEIKIEDVKGKKVRYVEMADGRKLPHMTESALRMPCPRILSPCVRRDCKSRRGANM